MQDTIIITGAVCSVIVLIVLWKLSRQLDMHTSCLERMDRRVRDSSEMITWLNKTVTHNHEQIVKMLPGGREGGISWKG